MSEVSEAYKVVRRLIDRHAPASREKSLAITNLEQSELWAKVATGEVSLSKAEE